MEKRVRMGSSQPHEDQSSSARHSRGEEALTNDPLLVYQQDADGESRYVYYGETARLRLLAVILTERRGKIRVITAYDLDAGQKRDYLERRARGD